MWPRRLRGGAQGAPALGDPTSWHDKLKMPAPGLRSLKGVLQLIAVVAFIAFLFSLRPHHPGVGREPIDFAATEALLKRAGGRPPVDISFIIPHYLQASLVTRAIDSIFAAGFSSFEVIVVNDGGKPEDVAAYHEMVERYAAQHPGRVLFSSGSHAARTTHLPDRTPGPTTIEPTQTPKVRSSVARLLDTTLAGGAADLSSLRVLVDTDPKEPTPSEAQPLESRGEISTERRIVFLNKPFNSGLSETRNYALQYAVGRWVCALDADDWLLPGIAKSLRRFLDARRETLQNTLYDVIITDLQLDGSVWSPLPTATADIRLENPFHVSAFYRRELVKYHRYRSIFFFGWEDWDFWLNLHHRLPSLKVGYIREPLVYYSAGSMHHYCIERRTLCRCLFRLANTHIFMPDQLIRAAWGLVEGEAHNLRDNHRFERLVTGNATVNPIVHMWHACMLLSLDAVPSAEKTLTSLAALDATVIGPNMPLLADFLLHHHHVNATETLRSYYTRYPPDVVPIGLEAQDAEDHSARRWLHAEHCWAVEKVVMNLRADTTLFHYYFDEDVLSSPDMPTYLIAMSSIAKHHPRAYLVMHLLDPRQSETLHELLVERLGFRVIFSPWCIDYLAVVGGNEMHISRLRKQAHLPYYRQYMLNTYRLLVTFRLGGASLDPHIVFAASVDLVQNVFASRTRPDTLDTEMVDMAFFKFERNNLFCGDHLLYLSMNASDPDAGGAEFLYSRFNAIRSNSVKYYLYVSLLSRDRFMRPMSKDDLVTWFRDPMASSIWGILRSKLFGVVLPPVHELERALHLPPGMSLLSAAVQDSLLNRIFALACAPDDACDKALAALDEFMKRRG